MKISDHDHRWMQHAHDLARRGIGLCSPNPVVGCAILDRDGQLAGEGWHEYDRLDHAEVVALRAAGERARGAAAYVTLEPCNHTGRTPPCTQALIQAGIARVVAATTDPNPNVAGGGLQALRAAGIETAVGVCEADARRLNEGFARWSQSHRPFVLMKVAMSLDGRIAPPAGRPTSREPYWVTGEPARAAVQSLRWQVDAVLTGIGTVLADDPLLTDRSGRPRRRPLLRVILDSSLRIPLESKIVTTAQNDVLIFTALGNESEGRIRELAARGVRVQILPAETQASAERPSVGWVAGRVPLSRVLDRLGAEGILTLLTETGTRLNTELLAAGMVDRIHFYVSPQIMGANAIPAFQALPGPVHAASSEIERYGDDLGLSSLLRDPWPEGKGSA